MKHTNAKRKGRSVSFFSFFLLQTHLFVCFFFVCFWSKKKGRRGGCLEVFACPITREERVLGCEGKRKFEEEGAVSFVVLYVLRARKMARGKEDAEQKAQKVSSTLLAIFFHHTKSVPFHRSKRKQKQKARRGEGRRQSRHRDGTTRTLERGEGMSKWLRLHSRSSLPISPVICSDGRL